ncbi:MAG TPA: peptidase MA family metallohydrolase [Ktedonobacteraceae bacterium]
MFARHTRYLLIFVTSICLSLLILTIHASHTLAAANPITVTSQTDTVTFPKSIDFQVSATDLSSTITNGTVFIKDSNTPYNTPHIVNIAAPAHTITLHSDEDISGTDFTSPGTEVSYYWQLQDAQGNTYTSPSQTFTVTDTRFAWQHLNQGKLQVNWYNRSVNFGQIILSQANASLNRIAGNLGGSPLYPINLWIYQTTSDFHGSLPPGTYEWVGGIAFPRLNQASVVVQNPADVTLIRDMPHELTHLLFHQLGGQNSIYTPTWFDEGLAVYNQAYHEAAMKQTFQQALKNHSLVPLNTIETNFPADANKAYLAYAQSWNLVAYMYTTFGEPKIAALIKSLHNPALDFNDELTRTLGIDQDHLENQWHLYLQQPATLATDQTSNQPLENPASVHIVSDPYAPLLILLGIFLVVMPLFGLGGLFTYQRRSHQRVQVSYQAQTRLNTPLPSYSMPPSTSQQTYADTPPSIPAPYPYYPAYPPQALPDTPKVQDRQDYPDDTYTGEKSWPSAYPPYKRSPQE